MLKSEQRKTRGARANRDYVHERDERVEKPIDDRRECGELSVHVGRRSQIGGANNCARIQSAVAIAYL